MGKYSRKRNRGEMMSDSTRMRHLKGNETVFKKLYGRKPKKA